jgi:hypothetical protein
MAHLSTSELEAGLDVVRASPADDGRVELIVCRPAAGERQVLDEAVLDIVEGLVGDNWRSRGSSRTEDGTAHPGMQVTLMNARAATLLAGGPERRPLAGDQLFVDLDLSEASLPSGTRLGIGTTVVEISAEPHTGCKKFAERFGRDAARFVNLPEGRVLRLRGVNAKVVVSGTVRPGDPVRHA